MSRYAFVVPRFGEEIAGCAETLAGSLACSLKERGDDVEVWTTCAKDNRTWENCFPSGKAEAFGLPVLRFPVGPRDLEIWIPHQIAISEGMKLSAEAEIDWMTHGVNSEELYEHIRAHAATFRAVFFAPYLFGTTFFGSLVRPDKSVLIPCLHDENYAYTDITGSMFRQVRGCLFNALPEQELAQALFGEIRGGEVGMGFDPPRHGTPAPYFQDRFPYVLYVGRKETGKNVQFLIDCFVALKNTTEIPELKLVIVGGGDFSDLHRPDAASRDDVVDLSHATEEEKQSLIAHSLFLCQPSRNESFSIVIMEAWLRNVPVVVHAGCAVTRHHVLESGGGLYFSNEEDFIGVCKALSQSAALRVALGEAGREYVERRYSWKAVLERFDGVMESIFPVGESAL